MQYCLYIPRDDDPEYAVLWYTSSDELPEGAQRFIHVNSISEAMMYINDYTRYTTAVYYYTRGIRLTSLDFE